MEMVRYFKDIFVRITELNMAWAKEKAKTRAEVGTMQGKGKARGKAKARAKGRLGPRQR
jgi:hypothetical protein